MTSTEKRREGRYQRRKAAREQKKRRLYAQYDDFDRIISYRALYNANRKCKSGVMWKASVQRYQMHLLKNIAKTKKALANGKDITKGFVEFDIMERGKLRHIRSVHYSERVVQRSLCDNALVPMLRKSLIYDNGACLPKKGIDQSLERLIAHLQQFFRVNGHSNEGWAVLYDFSQFFDSIQHQYCFKLYQKAFTDQRILWLLHCFVRPFGYPSLRGKVKRNIRHKQSGATGYTGKSLGLGSQISQITAVAYPSVIDHFIKEKMRVRFYGRYMDDGYMLFRTKAEAQAAIVTLTRLCSFIGITVNARKTHIAKIKHGIRFLKVKMTLTDTGKVKLRMTRKSIIRQRRKLKSFAAKKELGKMGMAEIVNAYASWKGHALRRGGAKVARNMDKLFVQLFGVDAPVCKIRRRKQHGKRNGKPHHQRAGNRGCHRRSVFHRRSACNSSAT